MARSFETLRQSMSAERQQANEERRAFPLVLLDAHMPDMDGFTVAELIRQDPELDNTRIMMLTSAGLRGDAWREGATFTVFEALVFGEATE